MVEGHNRQARTYFNIQNRATNDAADKEAASLPKFGADSEGNVVALGKEQARNLRDSNSDEQSNALSGFVSGAKFLGKLLWGAIADTTASKEQDKGENTLAAINDPNSKPLPIDVQLDSLGTTGGAITKGIGGVVRSAPVLAAGSLAGMSVGVPLAFGAETYQDTGDVSAAAKSALTAALFPAVGKLLEPVGVAASQSLIKAGLLDAANTRGQKAVEALVHQAGFNAVAHVTSLPDYLSMTPEQRRLAFIENTAANTVFSIPEVIGIANKSVPSATQRAIRAEITKSVDTVKEFEAGPEPQPVEPPVVTAPEVAPVVQPAPTGNRLSKKAKAKVPEPVEEVAAPVTPVVEPEPVEVASAAPVTKPVTTDYDAANLAMLEGLEAKGTLSDSGKQALAALRAKRGVVAPEISPPVSVVPAATADANTAGGKPLEAPAVTSKGESLFREASAADADSYVNPATSATTPFGVPHIYAATKPELALGQGSSKTGIVIEIDPKGLDVRLPKNQKPGAAFVEANGGGAERVIVSQPSGLRNNIRSITVPNGKSKDPYVIRLRNFLKQNWEAEKSGTNTIYRPKAEVEKEPVTPLPEPAVVPTRRVPVSDGGASANQTPVAVVRTLDTSGSTAFGPSFNDRFPEKPPASGAQKLWWKNTVMKGGTGTKEVAGESKKTLILRDADGNLHEVSAWTNKGEKIVDPETGKAASAFNTETKKGALNKYTVVAILRHAEPIKGRNEKITPEELLKLREESISAEGAGIEPVANDNSDESRSIADEIKKGTLVVSDNPAKEKVVNGQKNDSPSFSEAADFVNGAGQLDISDPHEAQAVLANLLTADTPFVQRWMKGVRDRQTKSGTTVDTVKEYQELAEKIYDAYKSTEKHKADVASGKITLTEYRALLAKEISKRAKFHGSGDESRVSADVGSSGEEGDAASGDAIDEFLTSAIKATDYDPSQANEGVTGAPVWIARGVANAALRATRLAYRAGKSIAEAIADGLALLRGEQGFNEEEARAWLANAVPAGEAGKKIDLGDPDIEPQLPNERWIKTQVQGVDFYVRERDQLTPESAALSTQVARDVLSASGFAPELKTWTDERDPFQPTKSIFLIPKTDSPNEKGRALATALEREIATRRTQGKGEADRVAMLLNTVRENFDRPESAFADMDTAVRNRLFAIAQEEASFLGRSLRALRGFANDVIQVGRNVDVYLGKIYSDAFGGDVVRGVTDRISAAIRTRFNSQEVEAIADRLLSEQDSAAFAAAVRRALAGDFTSSADVEAATRTGLIDGGMTEAQADKVIETIGPKIRQGIKDAGAKAAKDVLASLTPKERQVLGGKKWKTVEELIGAGVFSDIEALKALAKKRGWRVPSEDRIAEMRQMAEQEQAMLDLTPAERAAAGEDPAKLKAMQDKVAGATEERRFKIQKKLAVMWSEMTLPTSWKKFWQRDVVTNNARYINELISANLLFRASFATKQGIDVMTQWAWRMPGRAVAQALTLRYNDIAAGRPTEFWRDSQMALKNIYKDSITSLRPALVKARAALAGRVQVRSVDRMMNGVSALDRLWNQAESLEQQGKFFQAFLKRSIAVVGLSYRVAGAMDFVHGLPAEWNHRRFRIIEELRKQGVPRFAAEEQSNWVMDTSRAELAEAVAMTRSILEARGETITERQLQEDALNLLQRRQFQKMNELGLAEDDIRADGELYRNTLGWNERESKGVGGLVGTTVTATGRIFESIGLPLAIGRFGNAIAIGINRQLQRTALYALSDAPFLPSQKGESSPWFRTRTDIYERRLEAAAGTLLGSVFLGLAWAGIAKVWLKPPADKEERDIWDKQGHKAPTVEFSLGDGEVAVFSLTAGPLALLSPYLAAGGALNDLTTKQEKAQAKLNTEAARLGLTPGKAASPNISDWIGVAAAAGQASILGNRTSSGLLYSVTDYGTPNVKKFIGSQISPIVPGLPWMQEISRMSGVVIDPQKASLWDFIVPLSTSSARKVNMLGDPVGTESDVQRIFQTLSGGSYPVVNTGGINSQAAYTALINSGYRPPSVNPAQGYAVNGEYRPLNNAELQRYTELRGQYLKEGLTSAGPEATETEARAAYQQANARALSEVGVTPASSGGGVGSGSSAGSQRTAAGGIGAGAGTGIGSAGGFGGGRASRLGGGGIGSRLRVSAGSVRPSAGSRLTAVRLPRISPPSPSRVTRSRIPRRKAGARQKNPRIVGSRTRLQRLA